MVIALLENEKNSNAIIDLFRDIGEDLDKDFLFFYTDDKEYISSYKSKIDDLPDKPLAIFAQCG